ncbi:MAG: NAD(P)H-dependent glycerol-3-phosphate dehydrogenase [Candidatus Planktophila sp.]|jgi:glycerol-3-phosphate dehydrogenase (NAD(P)+)|tara:strand:+ start:934 stop:1935 length:1002 start_codon:yes stop_codon:yes gene_type:complete
MSKVTVFGAGAWGSTLAQVLSDAGNEVLLWGRSEDVVNEINESRTNKKYLGGYQLPTSITATTNLDEAFNFTSIYILAIPSQQLRKTLEGWKSRFSDGSLIISTLKGIEVSSQLRMTEVIQEILGSQKLALITGPNLSDELILRQPAGAVAAATEISVAEEVRALFTTPYYRVYTSVDLLGCELAGAIKNVIAVAVGISIGLGFGENTQAMLITRGLNEVARLCAAHGADPLSAAGLAGMGDLVATCGSPLSRNRTFGELLGKTGAMDLALSQSAKTVEGVSSSGAILEIAHRVGVEVPVIEAVANIVSGSMSPTQALLWLMEITTKAENFIR